MRFKAGYLLGRIPKGFLGPIGDDLPSLIPLVFGLIVFFTVFTQTFNTFDERNTTFRDALGVIRLSDILVGNSYIVSDSSGSKQFDLMCETAQSIRTMNWKAGLIALDVSSLEAKPADKYFQGIDVSNINSRFFTLEIEPGKTKNFSCTNTNEPLNYFSQNKYLHENKTPSS